MMKKWIMMAALFGCLFAGVSTVQAQEVTPDEVGYIVKVGDEAPDFEMTLTAVRSKIIFFSVESC